MLGAESDEANHPHDESDANDDDAPNKDPTVTALVAFAHSYYLHQRPSMGKYSGRVKRIIETLGVVAMAKSVVVYSQPG